MGWELGGRKSLVQITADWLLAAHWSLECLDAGGPHARQGQPSPAERGIFCGRLGKAFSVSTKAQLEALWPWLFFMNGFVLIFKK